MRWVSQGLNPSYGLFDPARRLQSLEGFRLGRARPSPRQGMIHDPVGKVKSVVFTQEGLERAKALFEKMFKSKMQM
jgi:hypothetical protein